MTSVLPPAPRIAFAVESSVDWVRPQRTTLAPRVASLRAMAAPIPRPAPVMSATCPTKGCPVSIYKALLPVDWGAADHIHQITSGTSAASAMRILAINRRAIGKSLAFGGRGTYNPANREEGSGVWQAVVTPCPRRPARK